MLIGDRIKLIMKANRMNAAQFAESIGVKPANLSHILSGRNKPSMDFLEKVLLTFENVNASWLITGEIKKEEHSADEGRSTKSEDKTTGDLNSIPTNQKIERIVVFFEDGTFKSYTSSFIDDSTGD